MLLVSGLGSYLHDFQLYTTLDSFRCTFPLWLWRISGSGHSILLILFPNPVASSGVLGVKKLAGVLWVLTKCLNIHSPLRSPGKWETKMQVGPFPASQPNDLAHWSWVVLNLEAASEYLHPRPRASHQKLSVKWPIQPYRASRGNAHEIDLEVLGNCKLHKNPW